MTSPKRTRKSTRTGPAPLPEPAKDASDVVVGKFGWDDIGNGRRLVSSHGDQIRWVTEFGGWVGWHEESGVWRRDPDSIYVMPFAKRVAAQLLSEAQGVKGEQAMKSALAFARASANVGKLEAMLKCARSEPGVAVSAGTFDFNKRLLTCANGALELTDEGAKFRERRREDFSTLSTGIPYLRGERHEVWTEFLETFLPNKDERDWVQRIAGYSMVGGNPHRIFAILRGPTTSGKSFLVNALSDALGTYAGPFKLQMLRAKQDSDLNPELAQAMPRRLIFTEEASAEWKLHTDEIKRLVGETASKARLPFAKASIERLPDFVPWMVTNALPSIDAADLALKRRLLFVPFRVTLSRADERVGYRDIVRNYGLPAVLAWAVEGWNEYVQAGSAGLEPPLSAAGFAMDQMSDLNDVERFLADVCVREAEASAHTGDLFEAYQAWCERSNIASRDVYSSTRFGRYLSDNGMPGSVRKVDGKTARVRVGVRLKRSFKSR